MFGVASRRAVAGLLALVAAPLAAQTTISTEPIGPSFSMSSTSSFATLTFGQSFMAPNATDVVLQSFRLTFDQSSPATYTASLWFFNTAINHAAGTPFFTQSGMTSTSPTPVTFTPNLLLAPSQMYALFITTTGTGTLQTFRGSDPYANGQAYAAAGSPATTSFAPAFAAGIDDFAFSATFVPLAVTTAPEPATLVLLTTGLLSMAAIRFGRRRTR